MLCKVYKIKWKCRLPSIGGAIAVCQEAEEHQAIHQRCPVSSHATVSERIMYCIHCRTYGREKMKDKWVYSSLLCFYWSRSLIVDQRKQYLPIQSPITIFLKPSFYHIELFIGQNTWRGRGTQLKMGSCLMYGWPWTSADRCSGLQFGHYFHHVLCV